ncbi:MAG: DUF6982 domain-containing protein [Candidatus Rokuibacteriota bacterium]
MGANHRKVVARYLDGRLVKGYTFDFGPAQPRFHVFAEPSATGPSTRILLLELKALFFVRDFAGDPAHQEARQFAPGNAGRHVEVRFRDGEVMVGAVDGMATDDPGFFLVPADPESNNVRVYVIAAATRAVYPLPAPALATAGSRSTGGDRSRPESPAAPPLPSRLLAWLTR